jgi:hypothetical protein
LGVRPAGQNIRLSGGFRLFCLLVRSGQTAVVLLLIYDVWKNVPFQSRPVFGAAAVFLAVAAAAANIMFLLPRSMETGKAKALTGIQFMSTFLLMFLFAAPFAGVWIPLGLFLFFCIWTALFNVLTYGRLLVFLPPEKKEITSPE